jgi:prepilin-type N-terminal cleavage/methylation domain-containing protein
MDKKSGGFTLIELVVVVAILAILAAVAVPRITGFKSMAEDSVCDANRKTLERMYSAFLVEKDIDHEDSIFSQFLTEHFDEICPAGGIISYEDGEVKCSVHGSESEGEEEGPGEEVPWL